MLIRSLFLICVLVLPLAGQGTFSARVNHAIDRGARSIILAQDHEGVFRCRLSGRRMLGSHVLATFALLHSGISGTDPVILKAKRPLLVRSTRTYATALRLMVIDELRDAALRPLARKDAEALIRGQGAHGAWHYNTGKPAPRYDNSCTQYAILGLRAAQNMGYPVPVTVWRRALRHLLADQGRDGGMGYQGKEGTASMTAGCLSSLVIVAARCGYSEDYRRMKHARTGIRRATAWLALRWKAGDYYTAYGLERGMLLSRQKRLGTRDWYREGAEWLLASQRPDGRWNRGHMNSTAFALLFLTRASRPTSNETPANFSSLFARLIAQPPAAEIDRVVEELATRGQSVGAGLLPYLLSESRPVRTVAVRALRRVFDSGCSYDPDKRPSQNRDAITRWREVVASRTRRSR